jgi:hypothetical protein
MCLLRVSLIVDAVKWGVWSIVHCTWLGYSRSPAGFAEAAYLLGIVIVLAHHSLSASYACYTPLLFSTIRLNSV